MERPVAMIKDATSTLPYGCDKKAEQIPKITPND
jgi:hypothetical protein